MTSQIFWRLTLNNNMLKQFSYKIGVIQMAFLCILEHNKSDLNQNNQYQSL